MTSLRVIGGTAKGQRLRSVPGDTTRPVTDRVKEALFNILGADIQGAAFLDLFGGTGAIGIEALSRGAAYVLFTDLNRLPVETIRANLKSTRLEERGEVLRADALTLLERVPQRQPGRRGVRHQLRQRRQPVRLPRRHRADGKLVRDFLGHIFHAVHCKIYGAAKKLFLNLFYKKAFPSDLCEGNVKYFVAFCFDYNYL